MTIDVKPSTRIQRHLTAGKVIHEIDEFKHLH